MDVRFGGGNRGFTLVEMVIVITLIGVAVIGVTAALHPRSKQSAEQVIAVKAADLGRATLDEIMGRTFDQNSGSNGGTPECALTAITFVGQQLCTAPANLGPDLGETDINGRLEKILANDVDDFNGLRGSVEDILGDELLQDYRNFQVEIDVFYDSNSSGISSLRTITGTPSLVATHYKRINVTIVDPQSNRYTFSAIRGNY